MKNFTKLILGFLFASVILTGCKEAEEILYVNFKADYDTSIDVNIPPTTGGKIGTDGTFSVNETIDPTTNLDYSKYINNIKEVDIKEVKAEVISITKNIVLQSVNLSVTNTDNAANWSFANEPIEVGTILTLGNEQGQWTSMTNIMLGKSPFTVKIDGATDEDDVDFVVKFSLKSEVTASPL